MNRYVSVGILLDYYDSIADQSSMARTTGFPATAMGRMIADGTIDSLECIHPKLSVAIHMVVNRLLTELESRNIKFVKTMESVR